MKLLNKRKIINIIPLLKFAKKMTLFHTNCHTPVFGESRRHQTSKHLFVIPSKPICRF
jgi:hypothetical protein